MLIVNCTPLCRKDGGVGGKERGRDDERHDETGEGGGELAEAGGKLEETGERQRPRLKRAIYPWNVQEYFLHGVMWELEQGSIFRKSCTTKFPPREAHFRGKCQYGCVNRARPLLDF